MSETVTYVGKLTPIEKKETLEETACLLIEKDFPKGRDTYYETCLEQLEDMGYKEYVIANDKIFKAEYSEEDPYQDVFEASLNEDGTINFVVKYYNGGCGFDEAIEYALKKLK